MYLLISQKKTSSDPLEKFESMWSVRDLEGGESFIVYVERESGPVDMSETKWLPKMAAGKQE